MGNDKISKIVDGTVIDHIDARHTFKIVEILDLENYDTNIISIGSNLDSNKLGKKGLIKIGGRFLEKSDVDKISIFSPDATLAIIKDSKLLSKEKLKCPEIVKSIIKCSNPKCITNADKVETKFYVREISPLKIECAYCERSMKKMDIKLF